MSEQKIFFTGDLHLGHKDILIYEREFRPFKSIEEMHEKIIENWNTKIINDDSKCYILGDLTFTSQKNTTDIISKLKGIKYLVKGFHDVKSNQWYRDCGIDEVYDEIVILKKFEYFTLSHEAMLYIKPPFINIHAHSHSSPNIPTFTPASACVSLDRWNMSPVSAKTIELNIFRLQRQMEATLSMYKPIETIEDK